jgi:hypothetical protein
MFNVQQTIDDLSKAIDHLRETPWIQGRLFSSSGACCAWGAVVYATASASSRSSAHEDNIARSANVGRAFYRAIGTDLVAYNDAEGRTKDQVIRTMETVLSALKADPSILTAKKGDSGEDSAQ